ncbi:putative polynucleotide adenylyltransferase [Lupinus albus]|uniref:Putative polynucleotide adenylyltransferase n=1 Tax=Lupinus albus TaxID=3870 RepID=A0A6A4QKH0_LUPAL|nr:putative polynucleotide adenylyltransferase [Lupinus albus]
MDLNSCVMEDTKQNLSPFPNPKPLSIDAELWEIAEERVQEILNVIQPNVVSESIRKEIIDYVQWLIRGYYGAEVLPFGSVPLKTYLPDGDIDFTVLSHENSDEDLAQAVCNILQSEQVKDIKHIHAQVQVVKCTVKNIAVDISFNQMAGLYALRFFEQVDEMVGRDHLLKRSIILIKAWLYYEGRMLGSHNGLLSTYAVEILVLYIINRFHKSLFGPLEVLYLFLDYYSKFDWETNYVSVDGPKPLSSLPEIVETPECDCDDLLLSKEFLSGYRDIASKTTTRGFPPKYLNIMDPLRSDNNLGRSVSIGSLRRIKLALGYGARKLKDIFELPGEKMGAAIEVFFKSTLDRNGKGERPDVAVPVPAFGIGKSLDSDLNGDCDSYFGDLQNVQAYHVYAKPLTSHSSSCPSSPPQVDVKALSSTQQNWNMFYPVGTNVYVPGQTPYYPNVLSRGTGTYIPDMSHTSYRDMHSRVTIRPKKSFPVNHNVLLKSPRKKQPVEVHSETETEGKPRSPFELVNEEFPLLSTIRKTSPSEPQESVRLTKEANIEPSDKELPLLRRIHTSSQGEESVNLTEQARNSSSPLLNIEFGTFCMARSGGTMLAVPRVAMDRKEKLSESDKERWIDSI